MLGGGNNYRALEYKTESGTYYTSAVNSNGLSSTTALTRESTSGTNYGTETFIGTGSYIHANYNIWAGTRTFRNVTSTSSSYNNWYGAYYLLIYGSPISVSISSWTNDGRGYTTSSGTNNGYYQLYINQSWEFTKATALQSSRYSRSTTYIDRNEYICTYYISKYHPNNGTRTTGTTYLTRSSTSGYSGVSSSSSSGWY